MAENECDVLIVGGGPAGLRAAEVVSSAGLTTVLADHKPSVGRKFLVAGRGGLNLTHSESVKDFPKRYGDDPERWQSLLTDFSPQDLRAWAEGLGIETFIGTSGRVFPLSKQAAPLLRRWIERLRKHGVHFRLRHQLQGFRGTADELEVDFAAPDGTSIFRPRALLLALGGASWPQTGSDGNWVRWLDATGVNVTPLAAANCGWEVDWPPEFLALAEGLPLKNIVVRAGDISVSGELLITQYGIEGGAIYQLGRILRGLSKPQIEIDLKPTFTLSELLNKLAAKNGTRDLLAHAARAWRLGPAAQALLASHLPISSPEALAATTKSFPLSLGSPRPIAEAISSAGGIRWTELNDDLMLRRHPGIFCAGEMIDWEAPTGGYLLQGCFSTATRAARGIERFLILPR